MTFTIVYSSECTLTHALSHLQPTKISGLNYIKLFYF